MAGVREGGRKVIVPNSSGEENKGVVPYGRDDLSISDRAIVKIANASARVILLLALFASASVAVAWERDVLLDCCLWPPIRVFDRYELTRACIPRATPSLSIVRHFNILPKKLPFFFVRTPHAVL